MKNHKTILMLTGAAMLLSACATQRYGRLTDVSATEMNTFTCRDLQIEIAKANEFLASVRDQRRGTSGAHVLGALGDFGIGNVMEGDAAEESGEKRLRTLQGLYAQRGCGYQSVTAQ